MAFFDFLWYSRKTKNAVNIDVYSVLAYFGFPTGGEWGIRTPGPVTVNSFQDCRNRPLCQLSFNSDSIVVFSGANIEKIILIPRIKKKLNSIFRVIRGIIFIDNPWNVLCIFDLTTKFWSLVGFVICLYLALWCQITYLLLPRARKIKAFNNF